MNAGAAPTSRHRQDEGTSLWRRAAVRGGDAGVGETLPFLFGFAVNLKPLWKSRLKNKNNPAKRNRWKAAIAKCGRGGDTESVTRTSRRPVSPRGAAGSVQTRCPPCAQIAVGTEGAGSKRGRAREACWGGPPPRGGRRDTGQGRRGPSAGLRGLSMRFVFKVLRS